MDFFTVNTDNLYHLFETQRTNVFKLLGEVPIMPPPVLPKRITIKLS